MLENVNKFVVTANIAVSLVCWHQADQIGAIYFLIFALVVQNFED